MDSICDKISNYGHLLSHVGGNPKDIIHRFVKTQRNDGSTSSFVKSTSTIKNKLRHKCDEILDEHEEWFESFYSEPVSAGEADRELCLMRAGLLYKLESMF